MMEKWRKEYMWGFTQGNPIKYSQDRDGFGKLMSLVNTSGAISLGLSLHPYHIIDREDVDIWEEALTRIETSGRNDIESVIAHQSTIHIAPCAEDSLEIIKWQDERLFIEHNAEFANFVPFVIPFLTYDDQQDPQWLTSIQHELKENYTAKNYLDGVNDAIRFFLAKPTLVLGFDIFDKNQPSQLVDHYIRFLENVIKEGGR